MLPTAVVSEMRWPGGGKEGGNTGRAHKGRAQLRKGEIKRNWRIKRREEESRLGVLLVPLAHPVELVSLCPPPQLPASGEFGANCLGRTERPVTPRRSGQHSGAQGRPLSWRREGRLVMGHGARSREGV